jgi:hypothetical protein
MVPRIVYRTYAKRGGIFALFRADVAYATLARRMVRERQNRAQPPSLFRAGVGVHQGSGRWFHLPLALVEVM